jgi:hypothetical protein
MEELLDELRGATFTARPSPSLICAMATIRMHPNNVVKMAF